jgi:hypothetical protein
MPCWCGKPVSCLATRLQFIYATTGLAKATGEALSASGWAVLGIETPKGPPHRIGDSLFSFGWKVEGCDFAKRGLATDQPVAAI